MWHLGILILGLGNKDCITVGRKKWPKIEGRIFKRQKKIMANFNHKAEKLKAENRSIIGRK